MKQFLSSSVLATALTISSPSMGKTPESIPGTLGDNQSTTLVDNTNQRTTHTLRAMPDYSSLGSLWFEKNYTEVPSREEQKVAIESGVSKAQDILTHMEKKWVITSDETILEEVFRQGKEQSTRIFHNLDTREAGSKEWWKALIELFAIVNFFTLLPWAYGQTIAGAKDGTGTKGITFVAFSGSNLVGMVASFLSWSPLLGSGYAVAFVSAIRTVNALSNRKQLNVSLAIELEEAKRTIQELTQKMAHQGFTIMDENGKPSFTVPYEYFTNNILFSIYNEEWEPLFFSDAYLKELNYTMNEIRDYYKKHGEVNSLFYPEPEALEHVKERLETLKDKPEGYTADFRPRPKWWDPKKKNDNELVLRFHTGAQKIYPINPLSHPIYIRRAVNVSQEYKERAAQWIDALTGEANRTGFEAYFNQKVQCIEQRKSNLQTFPKKIALAFGDIDFFKRVNDLYLHTNADIILRELAACFRRNLYPEDCVARIGGDEFGVICEWATKENLAKKLTDIRKEFSSLVFQIENGVMTNMISCKDKNEAQKFADAINTFESKNAGRCFIWGISFTMGVTGIETKGINSNEDASLLRAKLEFEADTALSYSKKLRDIFPECDSRNAVAYSEFNKDGKLLRIKVLYHTGETKIIEWHETFSKAEENIEKSVKKSLEERYNQEKGS